MIWILCSIGENNGTSGCLYIVSESSGGGHAYNGGAKRKAAFEERAVRRAGPVIYGIRVLAYRPVKFRKTEYIQLAVRMDTPGQYIARTPVFIVSHFIYFRIAYIKEVRDRGRTDLQP